MFLLEVSHNKFPQQMALGRKNDDCLINLKRNAFFNKKASSKLCLDPINDGYINRVVRLSLTLIDLLEPYIHMRYKVIKGEEDSYNLYLKWMVGGSINVDETIVLFDFVEDTKDFLAQINNRNKNSEMLSLFKHKSKTLKGYGVWNANFNEGNEFKYHVKFQTMKRHLVFVILARADSNWGKNDHPDPPVNPQAHIANLRNSDDYEAKNENFNLKGNKYQSSDIKIIDLKNLK